MIQQINLYQPGDSGKSLIFDPYLLSIFAAMAFFLILTGIGLNKKFSLESDHASLKMQENQLHSQIHQLQMQRPNQQLETQLRNELQQHQVEYQNLSQLSEQLADLEADRNRGFSRYLMALAKYADSRVWLTSIDMDAETGEIELHGATFKPEYISLLLQHLQDSNVFKGRHFAQLNMDQAKESPEQITFGVSSSLKADTEKEHAKPH